MEVVRRLDAFIHWGIIILLALTTVALVVISYMRFIPITVMRYDDGLVPIATEYIKNPCAKVDNLLVFRPGDIVPFHVRGEKFTDAPAQISPRLVNDIVIPMPDYTNGNPRGKFNFVLLSNRVPREAKTGIYHFEFTITFEVNMFRKETFKRISLPFRVIEDDASKARRR